MSAYKHLFFDLDHTLWDFEKNAEESLTELYQRHHLHKRQITATDFVQTYSRINSEMWELYHQGIIDKENLRTQRFVKTFVELGIEEQHVPNGLWDEYLELLPLRTNLLPHASDVLERFSGNFRMSIITNGFKEVQRHKMINSNIYHYFDHVLISEEVGFQKPDKEIFELALNLHGAKPDEVLMIGDSLHADIQGAINSGIHSVYFNPEKKAGNHSATFEISSLHQLPEIVLGNGGKL